ncbi:MAG: hypothetical protein HFJ49_00655 [Clostridia bacterium]|nr:hypothetical protein [Clostridia bacterium]
MVALKIKERPVERRLQASRYLNSNFQIGDWIFFWSENANKLQLHVTGGCFGNMVLEVQNPIQLAIAISAVTPCEVLCGVPGDWIKIQFGKRAFRETVIFEGNPYDMRDDLEYISETEDKQDMSFYDASEEEQSSGEEDYPNEEDQTVDYFLDADDEETTSSETDGNA